MKVLLINPPPTNKHLSWEMPRMFIENFAMLPPLGLMYIASYIREKLMIAVCIIDVKTEGFDYRKLQEKIKSYKPAIVGMTAYSHNLIEVLKIAKIVKDVNNETYVTIGGPHTKNFAYSLIKFDHIDFVVKGEGEIIFGELVKRLIHKENLSNLKGLIYKNGNKIINNNENESIVEDLDILPFPARDLISPNKYFRMNNGKKIIVTSIITSRGCPYRCSFCMSSGSNYRRRSIENVIKELILCKKIGIEEFHIIDETFNIERNYVIDFCKKIMRENLDMKWSFRGRADTIDKEMLYYLEKAGCFHIMFGVESYSTKGLKILNKDLSISDIKRTFKLIKTTSISTKATFMIGCPDQKKIFDVFKMLKFAKQLHPTDVIFTVLTPYPGTELYKRGVSKGIIDPSQWNSYARRPFQGFLPVYWEEYFLKKHLLFFLRISYLLFYLNSKSILIIVSHFFKNPTYIIRRLFTFLTYLLKK